MRHSSILLPILLLLALTGCGTGNTFSATTSTSGLGVTPSSAGTITGSVHGGNQPVTGAYLYLFSAGTTGYGSLGDNLLGSSSFSTSDGSGNKTNSNANAGNELNTLPAGDFTITNDYVCPASNPQVFLVAFGGNPGLAPGTDNSAIELFAALTDCNTLKQNASTYTININEVTTVGTVYALGQFLASGVGSYGYSQQGMINAFNTFHNLVDVSSGTARATTLSGTGTGTQLKINSIANALAPCVNSTTSTSTQCIALYDATETDTNYPNITSAVAAWQLSLHPGNTTAEPTRNTDVYNLSLPNAPFQPALTSIPNDWTLAVNYSVLANKPESIAVDSSGNIWTANYGASSVSLLSPTGVPATNSPFNNTSCSGCFSSPKGIAIDSNGSVWVYNYGNSSAMVLSSTIINNNLVINTNNGPLNSVGLTSPSTVAIDLYNNPWFVNPSAGNVTQVYANFTGDQVINGGSLSNPTGIAFDSSGNAWIANNGSSNLVEIQADGTFAANSPYSGAGLSSPNALAIDGNHHLWITNSAAQLSEFTDAGSPVASSSGGGIQTSYNVAVDGAGNVWSLNYAANSLSETSTSGAAITPSTGYTAASFASPIGLAIDASGNIWVGNSSGTGNTNYLTELIGVAAPTITPLATALQQGQLGQMPGTPVRVGIESVDLPRYNSSGTQTYDAQLYAYGGNSGSYTWSATGLPAGLSISSSGLISGQSTVVGPTFVSFQVCDTANSSNCSSASISMLSSGYNPTLGNEAALNGKYAFRFLGASSNVVASSNPPGTAYGLAFTGSFQFDGVGGVTGVMDINVAGAAFTGVGLSGTYSLGVDGRGTLIITPSGLDPGTWTFSVGNFVSGVAHTIHLVDFTNTNAQDSGANADAGIAKFQTSSSFTAATLNQSFVFGLTGETPCTNYNATNPSCPQTITPFGGVAMAGVFTGDNANHITSGAADASSITSTYPGLTLSGAYTSPDANGRGTLTLITTGTTIPLPPTHFDYFIVNSGELFLVSTDSHGAYSLLSGDALVQSSGLSNSTLTGNYVLSYDEPFGGDGLSTAATQADAAIFYASIDSGHANISLSGDENKGGSTRNQIIGSTPYTVASNGRMSLASGTGVVFYLAGPAGGFGIGQPSSPGDTFSIITMQAQAALTFSNSSVSGTYAFGTLPQPVLNSNNSGVFVTTASGSATATADSSQNTGILALDQTQTYTYSIDSFGRGTATDSSGGVSVLRVIDANNILILSENSGDTAPALVWLQQ
jgi:sugar lactone lactonase YvrE